MLRGDVNGLSLSIISLAGEFDLSRSEELRRALAALAGNDAAIVDLSRVTYLDSTALGCLIALKKHMAQNGGPAIVALAGANSNLRRLFAICEFQKLFYIYDSVSQAQEALRSDAMTGNTTCTLLPDAVRDADKCAHSRETM